MGIGASAGGLEAFKSFFSRIPSDTGMAFVLVQHLDPQHESALVQILSGSTKMKVTQAEDGAAILPNHVFVIPRDAILRVEAGLLRVARPAAAVDRRTSINTFFGSLAEDQGEKAVGVVLAGFGSDGALGVAKIKEYGGLTLAQAEFDHQAKSGMPQSAAASGFVDDVLPVEGMPAALIKYLRYRNTIDATKGPDGLREGMAGQLTTICAVLLGRLGRDFSLYKANTLMRRVQRRMQVLQISEIPHYIEQLRTLPHEPEHLFREILIGVTQFFRDPAAFETLAATVIPDLFKHGKADDPVRVWVAGCATGEEAYSLAILLREAAPRSKAPRRIQIFATDIDDRAIEAARAGLYPGTIAADVSQARLERHFVKEGDCFRVGKDLREMCLFSTHDVARDPPFSRLHLVSCRNLMIYFEPRLQQRIVSTFHYALRPKGYLFLGPAEAITAQTQLFSPLDKKNRIFQRGDAATRIPSLPPLTAPRHQVSEESTPGAPDDEIGRRAAQIIFQYAPAFVVVDEHHEVHRFSGPIAKFLAPTSGAASLNLFRLLHSDLRSPVRAALKKAAATQAHVVDENRTFAIAERQESVTLIVEPLPGAGERLFVVAFQEIGHRRDVDVAAGKSTKRKDRKSDRDANEELLAARERLQTVTEELETANEELQSSNEEYQSINEELQSAVEELETSKEELQSLNEELQTVNAELNNRNDDLIRASSDLANLFDSTAIATLFLDMDLRIKRFTPTIIDLFKIREADIGRPITDVVSRIVNHDVERDTRQVLRTLIPIEHEVEVERASSYLMQIKPYRNLKNVIEGAVITFVDITDRKRHENERARLAAIVESSDDAIISHDLNGIITTWNAGAEKIYGYPAGAAVGEPMAMLLVRDQADDLPKILTNLKRGESHKHHDIDRVTSDHRRISVSLTISPIKSVNGRIIGASAVARDVSERKQAEEQNALLLAELDHRVKNILAIVSAVVSQTLKTSETPGAFAASLEGRIAAIAKAHSLLTRNGQVGTSLHALVAMELLPYHRRHEHVAVGGDDVALTPKAGLSLAMAIHELASNAAKYGSLSTPEGSLAVTSTITGKKGNRTLTLDWKETGGPPVTPPSRRGFGTTLIERSLTHEFDATVKRDFTASGLRCIIVLPLTDEVGRQRNSDANGGAAQ